MNANQVAELFLEKEVPQGQLLNLGDFLHFAEERGIKCSALDREIFGFWDRQRLLRPIIKVHSLSDRHLIKGRLPNRIQHDLMPLNRKLKDGEETIRIYNHWYLNYHLLEDLRKHKERVIDLDSRWFQNWAHFEDEDGQTRITYWYHPFHIIRLQEILSHCELDVQFPKFKTFPLDKKVKIFYRGFQKIRSSVQSSEAKFLKQLALIVAIEDRYLPEVRRNQRYANLTDGWSSWATSFDCNSVLEKTGFSINEVRKMLSDFAWKWHFFNELGDWHLLIRHADYEARKQLRGKPRLALDYYEYAEMLRYFLKDATKEVQPSIEHLVSVGDIRSFLRPNSQEPTEVIVPALLRQFQLDPRYRVLFAVEGETEEAFIKTWCELRGVNLKRLGIRIFPFYGTHSLKTRHVKRELQNAKDNDAVVFLTVDDENDAENDLQTLVKEQLVDTIHPVSELQKPRRFPVGGFIWKPCFEDANFTPNQLVAAWMAAYKRRSDSSPPPISEEEMIKHMTLIYPKTRTWINALIQVAGKKTPVTKPELAAELARLCLDVDCDFTRLIRNVITHAC